MKTRIKNFFPSLNFSSPLLTSVFPLLLTFLTLFAGSVASAQIPSNGLVGYWPFNGNANDESGNGNNGTVNGGALLVTDRNGNVNAAYQFDGIDDFIQMTQAGPTGNTAVTVSFWMRTTMAVNNGPGEGIGHVFGYGANDINQPGRSFNITVNGSAWVNSCNQAITFDTYGAALSKTDVFNNSWNHYSIVNDPSSGDNVINQKIYKNGVLMSQTCYSSPGVPANPTNFSNAAPIRIGKFYGNNCANCQVGIPYFFQGALDDFSMYNRVLTPSEITQLYTDQTSLVEVPCTPFLGEDQTVCAGTSVTLSASGSSLACPTLPSNLQTGLVGYWPFCGNANDASGNGNNGTVNGATLTTDRFGNPNSAYSFDGNDWIEIPNSNTIQNIQSLTISGWIKVNDWFISNGDPYFPILCKSNTESAQGKYTFVLSPNSAGVLLNAVQGIFPLSSTFQTNQWRFLAISINSVSSSFYLDGVLIQTINSGVNPNPVIENTSILIGKEMPGLIEYCIGNIDDLTIHNRILSASEIQQLYTLGQSTYLWSTGATTASISVTPTQTTTYTCTVTDANGNACTDSVTVFVPQIEATDLTICAGESTTLSVSGINSTATTSGCPTLPTNLQTGLVGYWPFCGNANDASGNGNNGTVNGATLTTDRFGNANSAYGFDGVNDYIEVVNNSTLGIQQSGTISCWFYKANYNSRYEALVVKEGAYNNNQCNYKFQLSFANEMAFAADPRGVTGCNNVNGCYPNYQTAGTWHHVIGVISPQSLKFYIDGLLYGDTTILSSNNLVTNNLPLSFGRLPFIDPTIIGNERMYFDGKLDNICVWNRALTVSEIQQLYTLGQTTYLWSNGATTPTINVSPTTTTTYTCTVTTNGVSCTDSITVVVGNPVASISPNGIVEICQGQSISLTGNGGVSYLWNTGAPTQSITVNTEAVYTVTVTDANGCTDTESQLVKVNFLPNIGVSNASICAGQSATLTATGGVNYVWSPATGLSATTGSTVTASPATSTLYTVTGTGANGCTNTATAAVTVNTLPTATITAASATTFCQGGSVVLNANTGAGLTYQWFNNTSAISGATSASYTASMSGSYTVVVTNVSNCSSASTATVVTVNALPTATITPATATTFCQGGSVVLSANTGTGLTYQWRLNGNPISGATSSSYTANASGSYTVVVTNASSCSSTSTATVVTVNALPTATITAASATTFCQGGSVVLNANTGAGLSYQWRLNGNPISGATSSSYTATTSGSYTVVVTNASACSSTSTATVVTVNALPTATITPATATTFCQGGSVVLNANTGAGLSYQWRLNGNPISGSTSSSYTANASGSYTVVVTNASACSSTSTATVVTVNALPTATITAATSTTFCQGGSVVLNANTGTGLTYQWFNNASAISGATSASYTATTSGSYTVTVTNASACSSTSTAVDVTAVPNVDYFADADGDGFGDITTLISTCIQPQGYVTDNTDCKDNDAAIFPGAQEICNDIDDDCNDLIDDGLVFTTYYADADGDSFGDINNPLDACVIPAGYVTNSADCNDNNANQNTASTEICNGEDDDCDGIIDNGLIFLDYYADLDSDGFGAGTATNSCVDLGAGYVTNNTDCNDNNANQNTASTEICNGEDDDCDGTIDNGITFLDYYADTDGDGFGAGDVISSCSDLGAGYVSNNTDCDDSNSNINSSATETCNTIDDNCDGQIDEGVQTVYFIDNDGDTYGNPSVSILACTQPIGYTPDDTDCNDTDANINPGAEDIAGNGIDENCDGQIDNSIFELNATISLHPNPTRSELNIQVNSSIIGNDLYIFDAVGKLVHKQQLLSTQTTIPVSNFADGNYIVRVGEVVKRFEVMK